MRASGRGVVLLAVVAMWLALSAGLAAATPLTGDPYEPNDTTATATPITADGTVYTQYNDLEPGADMLGFSVTKGKQYVIDVWGSGGGRAGMVCVKDQSGTRLTAYSRFYSVAPDSITINYTAAADGEVYLVYESLETYWYPGDPLAMYHVKVTEHDPPTITGTVRNPVAHTPVEGALVRAWLNASYCQGDTPCLEEAYVTTLTAADGTYRLVMPKPGTVFLRFDDPSGSLTGEWYDSTPNWVSFPQIDIMHPVLRPIPTVEDSVAAGVDGALLPPGKVAIKFVRTDTGDPVTGVVMNLTTTTSNYPWAEVVALSASDADGFSVGPVDPRRAYQTWPQLSGRGVVPIDAPTISPSAGETSSVTIRLEPVVLITHTDARPVYDDYAEIHLSTSGNTEVEYHLLSLDGAPMNVGDVAATSVLGHHRLEFFSEDWNCNAGPTGSVEFTVVRSTRLSIATSANILTRYGQPVLLTGKLTLGKEPGSVLASTPVVVEASANGSSWQTVARLVTSDTGDVSWSTVPADATYYRLAYAGDQELYGSTTSAIAKVTPTPQVGKPKIAAKVSRKKYALVTGTLAPMHASGTQPIRIYMWRYVSRRWKSCGYVSAKASNLQSATKYSARVRLRYAGKWKLRAFAPADAAHAAAWSSGFAYTRAK